MVREVAARLGEAVAKAWIAQFWDHYWTACHARSSVQPWTSSPLPCEGKAGGDGLEIDEVVEVALERGPRHSQDRPVVELIGGSLLDERPREIRGAEPDGLLGGWELVIVEDNDSASAHETTEVDEVQEDTVEAVVAVDEGKIEPTVFGEEAR